MAAATAAVANTLKRREESKAKPLNAEQATVIAVDFLRRLGNKHKLKPKSATLQNDIYMVEVELKKATATVQISSLTREIKEYSIESKAEETTSFLPVNFKSILIMVAVSAATYIALSFLNIQSFF